MKKTNVLEFAGRDAIFDPLTDLLRSGAQLLITQAVEAELEELLGQHSDRRTEDGYAVVVRNGHLPERELQTGLGPVTVRIPKVRSRTGQPVTFRSAIVPPYVRKTRSLEAALPWLYLKGISSGEMGEALKVLIGPDAKGLSASTVSRLKQIWGLEYRSWCDEPLDKDRWVYVWADGIYSGLRGEQMKLCALVVIGVNERGEKHFLAIEDGMRESTQSWREVLLKLKSRGMNGPELAIVATASLEIQAGPTTVNGGECALIYVSVSVTCVRYLKPWNILYTARHSARGASHSSGHAHDGVTSTSNGIYHVAKSHNGKPVSGMWVTWQLNQRQR